MFDRCRHSLEEFTGRRVSPVPKIMREIVGEGWERPVLSVELRVAGF